jgi:hypothetical protein
VPPCNEERLSIWRDQTCGSGPDLGGLAGPGKALPGCATFADGELSK